MQLARVIGDVVSTIKDAQLVSHKLLLLQPIHPAAGQPVGRALVAVDATGAGVGEHVFFVRGKEASFPFLPAETPVDACVVGIVDHWDLEGAAESRPSAATAPIPVSRRPPSAARSPRSV
jgi:microcompartment protein CcmK/EutM